MPNPLGRPRSGNDKTVIFKIDEASLAVLDELAASAGMTRSAALRYLVRCRAPQMSWTLAAKYEGQSDD